MNHTFESVTAAVPQSNSAHEEDSPLPRTQRSVPETMRAVVQDRYGNADVLASQTIAVPKPGKHQVLIQVEAAGVDRGTWHLMTGLPYLVRLFGFGLFRPKQPVPGFDVSGKVVAIGEHVDDFQIGDRVLGVGSGTFAEYAVADTEKLAHLPIDVNALDAAAVPISGVTALEALRDVGKIQAGHSVLVMGASGGVGTYAVQLARHFGASVTGVASAAKLDLVRSLGAEQVLDYATDDVLDGSQRYDLIIDIGGRNPVRSLRRALTTSGTLVIVGGEGGDKLTGGLTRQLGAMMLSPFVSQRLTTFVASESGNTIKTLATMLSRGELVVPLERTYALEQAPAAIADLEAGRIRGKAIIAPGITNEA